MRPLAKKKFTINLAQDDLRNNPAVSSKQTKTSSIHNTLLAHTDIFLYPSSSQIFNLQTRFSLCVGNYLRVVMFSFMTWYFLSAR